MDTQSSRTIVVFSLVSMLLGLPCWGKEVSRQEHREAIKRLSVAASDLDLPGYLAALETVLRGNRSTDVKTAVTSYSDLVERALKKLDPGEILTLHGKAASAFRVVTEAKAVAEMQKLLVKHRQWPGRLLLLDAAGFASKVKLLDSCLQALKDKHPVVIRRALRYLSRAKKVPVVEAVVERYLELSAKKPKRQARSQHERTLLAFRSALHQLLGVDLPAPEDYRNYVAGRKNDPNLFEPRRRGGEEKTELTLFGAAVSGKNIIFVLDVSGSMLSTDPLPADEQRKEDRRTVVVGGPNWPPVPKIREDRRRITRARKELARVIRALPEDVQFNLVFYSSRVSAWKNSMSEASSSNKKEAVAFVEAAEAEGITVTDHALEQAFQDLALDTIYLITDGAPTHVGSSGMGKPKDADRIIQEIHKRVKELNFLRGVRIFTLGFRGAEEDFLRKLSADNSGVYVSIR